MWRDLTAPVPEKSRNSSNQGCDYSHEPCCTRARVAGREQSSDVHDRKEPRRAVGCRSRSRSHRHRRPGLARIRACVVPVVSGVRVPAERAGRHRRGGCGAAVPGGNDTDPFVLVPDENSAGDSVDGNVAVDVIVPAGWTSPVCGQALTNTRSVDTNDTNQPGTVVGGWECRGFEQHRRCCTSPARHQRGSTPARSLLVQVTVPSPSAQTTYDGAAGSGAEGLIVDQYYEGGDIVHSYPNDACQNLAGAVDEFATAWHAWYAARSRPPVPPGAARHRSTTFTAAPPFTASGRAASGNSSAPWASVSSVATMVAALGPIDHTARVRRTKAGSASAWSGTADQVRCRSTLSIHHGVGCDDGRRRRTALPVSGVPGSGPGSTRHVAGPRRRHVLGTISLPRRKLDADRGRDKRATPCPLFTVFWSSASTWRPGPPRRPPGPRHPPRPSAPATTSTPGTKSATLNNSAHVDQRAGWHDDPRRGPARRRPGPDPRRAEVQAARRGVVRRDVLRGEHVTRN